jgi:hypothetical protein
MAQPKHILNGIDPKAEAPLLMENLRELYAYTNIPRVFKSGEVKSFPYGTRTLDSTYQAWVFDTVIPLSIKYSSSNTSSTQSSQSISGRLFTYDVLKISTLTSLSAETVNRKASRAENSGVFTSDGVNFAMWSRLTSIIDNRLYIRYVVKRITGTMSIDFNEMGGIYRFMIFECSLDNKEVGGFGGGGLISYYHDARVFNDELTESTLYETVSQSNQQIFDLLSREI